jgi:hypothetical protein
MEVGSACTVVRDINIDGVLVFKAGQNFVVEKVAPNPQRPAYRYVVTSPQTATRYQLSDADVVASGTSQAQPAEANVFAIRSLRPVLIVAASVLVLALVAGAAYFLFFRTKTVPSVMGLGKQAAEGKITSAGYKVSCSCKYPRQIGSEKVVWQEPKAGTKDKKIETVKIVITDPAMESALLQAQQAVGQANGALQEAQAMGIDTADLAGPIQNAQAKLDNANSVADCVGATESASFWAGTVINSCNAKKQSFVAQQERSRQIANCRSAMISYARSSSASGMSMSFSSFSMNGDCTAASAWLSGSVNGMAVGQVKIVAVRRGESWVVTDFGTGI